MGLTMYANKKTKKVLHMLHQAHLWAHVRQDRKQGFVETLVHHAYSTLLKIVKRWKQPNVHQ
jgi:hypothetical protein